MPLVDLAAVPTDAATPTRPAGDSPEPLGKTRRLGLSLLELRHAALAAGGAPLPFDLTEPPATNPMQARLGLSPSGSEDAAYRRAADSLRDPAESLKRRGLLTDGQLDPGLAGALGLLATPRVSVEIDVRMGDWQARAWHRHGDGAGASLATLDGIAFEISWFPVANWAEELGRVATLSHELDLQASSVPTALDLPWELADAAAEAVRSGRSDLVPVLVARHQGDVRGPDGPVSGDTAVRALLALGQESHGRLRALIADVSGAEVTTVGVVSWTLVSDGWRSVRLRRAQGSTRVEVRSVAPADLAAALAPTLAPALPGATR